MLYGGSLHGHLSCRFLKWRSLFWCTQRVNLLEILLLVEFPGDVVNRPTYWQLKGFLIFALGSDNRPVEQLCIVVSCLDMSEIVLYPSNSHVPVEKSA